MEAVSDRMAIQEIADDHDIHPIPSALTVMLWISAVTGLSYTSKRVNKTAPMITINALGASTGSGLDQSTTGYRNELSNFQ